MSELYKDLQFTSFPDAIQKFVTMLDMTADDADAVANFQEAMEEGNVDAANQYYSTIANADQKFLDSVKVNTILDTCMALERFYISDIEPYIQNKQAGWQNTVDQFDYKGNYAAGTQYEVNNFVSYSTAGENQVYICINRPSVGTPPTVETYWRVMTIKGDTGVSGAGLTFKYGWVSSTNYYVDDVVSYNNIVWNCIKDNKNVMPGSDDTTWRIVYTASQDIYPFQADIPTNVTTGDLWFQITE